jgi:signal transduction histidine kinase/CHASE2 domain-containing sensor protein
MKAGPRWRSLPQIIGLSLILFVLVGLISVVPVIRELQVRLTDTLFQLVPPPKQRSPVVVILIDDESLQKYGRWPWSRELLARLVNNLSQGGAGTIGLDILLSERQSYSSDLALQQSITASGRAVIVDKIAAFPDGIHWIEPLPEFVRAAAAVGHAHAVLDPDNVCRSFPPRELTLEGQRWAFALEIARRSDRQRTAAFLAAFDVPESDNSPVITLAKPVLIPIAFRRDGFDTISAARVLEGGSLRDVRGRPVLVGFGPTEIGDRLTTPLSNQLPTPGVEVHAQILDSILSQRILHEAPFGFVALTLFLTSVLVVILFRRWRGFKALVFLLAITAAIYGLTLLVFTWTLRIVPAGPLVMSVVLGPLLVYASDFVNVERSVSRQLLGLRSWLALRGRELPREDSSDLTWRLELLQRLQTELGSLYELHETLLESTQDLVAIFDHDRRLLLKNRAFSAAFGYSLHSVFTLDQIRSRLVSKEDAPLVSNNSIEEGEVYFGRELYSARIAPLPPTTLSPGGGTILTLTNLRTRVERDRARAEALGFITHELRTPIASIQGFAELMMQYPGSDDAKGAPETIYLESKRLLALISSYLDVLRLDAGAKPLSLHMVDLVAIVYQIFDILRPLADASGMGLILESPQSVAVVADPPLVSGAILNLVSNAIKYGRPKTEICVSCHAEADEVLITVHNFGAPIGHQEIPRIFEPYYRASNPESTKTGGGLGLAFVKRIAEKHGGLVRAQSTADGMLFEIHLPASSDASMSAKESI